LKFVTAGSLLKASSPICLALLLAPVVFFTAPIGRAQTSSLPDAPRPQHDISSDTAPTTEESSQVQDRVQDQTSKPDPLAPSAKADPQSASPIAHATYEKRKWAQYVDPGEKIPALYPEDKWVFWLHEEARISSAAPALISAGYGQLTGSPAYGSDSGAFGDRVAAALVRQATMRFFASSLFPVITEEDPRYYRKASGSLLGRTGWAAERALITQRDSGHHSFNFSDIFGHLAASALTPIYYPSKSRSVHVVMQTWGTSIAGAAGNNLFLEFVPDALNAWRNRKHPANSSGTP
jgi:hypothetical protein